MISLGEILAASWRGCEAGRAQSLRRTRGTRCRAELSCQASHAGSRSSAELHITRLAGAPPKAAMFRRLADSSGFSDIVI